MKVLGVVPGKNELRCALVEGTSAAPILNKTLKVQKIAVDPTNAVSLRDLFNLLVTWVMELHVDKVCILQAGTTQFGGASSARVKVETVIQLVGAHSSVNTSLVPPQTLRAREKKFASKTGNVPESVLNGGAEFTPKAWRDAVLTAWTGLE
jgi:hypothetical protein